MTTVRLSRFPERPQVYGGIRKNIHLWRKTIKSHSPIGTFLIPFLLVDSPFSLATDTAFLPVTIPTELFLLGQQKKNEEPRSDRPRVNGELHCFVSVTRQTRLTKRMVGGAVKNLRTSTVWAKLGHPNARVSNRRNRKP